MVEPGVLSIVDDPEPCHARLTVARSFVQDDDLPADLDQCSVDCDVGHTEARDDGRDDDQCSQVLSLRSRKESDEFPEWFTL